MKAHFTKVNYDYGKLDDLPLPDYEPFGIKEMVDNYSMATRLLYRYSRPNPRPFIITMSRGCPFACSFCINHHRNYRSRSLENVMEEISQMYYKYKFNVLIILDELFAINKQMMKDFCQAMIKGRVTEGWDFDWCFQTHANARLDLESLQMAKDAGCYFFSYGFESASPTVLKSMHKHIKPEQIAEAIQLAEKVGIGFGGNLIFGDPAETELTLCESMDFYFHHCQSQMVFLGVVVPYPGGEIFDQCIQKGIIKDKAQYYETCRDTIYNMTQIPSDILNHWLYITQFIEHAWLWIKPALEVKYEIEENYHDPMLDFQKAKMYSITCKCPYCSKEIHYRQGLGEANGFIGVGCTNCGKRIRVNLGTRKEAQSSGA